MFKTALLMTEDNIVGREILLKFSENKIRIDAIIVEKSIRAEREKEYLKNDFYNPPSFAELVNREGKVHLVTNLNGKECVEKLRQLRPDVILLDGSTIIRKKVFSLARIGAINAHPGILPEYRGVDSVRWAIYHREPVGGTAHLIDEGLDTGPILRTREVPYSVGESLLEIRVRVMRVCVQLMAEAVQGLIVETIVAQPQPEEGGYYSWAPPEVQKAVENILSGKQPQ